MDKFQTELLAQLKEHNRLTKELVKLQRADYEMKKVNTNTEIFSAVKPRPAYWIISPEPDKDDYVGHMCSNCNWTRHTYSDSILWKYCPNCGMKMSMEKEGEEVA